MSEQFSRDTILSTIKEALKNGSRTLEDIQTETTNTDPWIILTGVGVVRSNTWKSTKSLRIMISGHYITMKRLRLPLPMAWARLSGEKAVLTLIPLRPS